MITRRFLSLDKRRTLWSASILLLLVCGGAAFVAHRATFDTYRNVVAASRLQSEFRIDSVSCLSISPHKVVFDQKDYWDPKLIEEIVHVLSIKSVLLDADYGTCRWGFFATVVPGIITAVRYQDQLARYLVSIGICERTVDGLMNPNKCLTKNVYVFSAHREPGELFHLGLVGLARSQTNEWEVFRNERQQ